MDRKHILLSALSLGVGVSVGLALASGHRMGRWVGFSCWAGTVTEEQLENELRRQLVDGRESDITFEKFPSFLGKQTRELLTTAAHFCLKNSEFSKHTHSFTPAGNTVLLSGPSELYLQRLAKALAHFFEAKLLLLDVDDFSLKMWSKYGCPKKESARNRRKSVMPILDEGSVKCTKNWAFDEKHLLQSLHRVLVSVSEACSVILYIKGVEKLLLQSDRFYKLLKKMVHKLSGSVLIVGSHMLDHDDEDDEIDDRVSLLFPHAIEVQEPDDVTDLVKWSTQLEEEKKMIQFQENKTYMSKVLAENDLDCDDLGSICHADSDILTEHTEEIVISAISHHLMNNKNSEYRNGKLVLSSKSLVHGLNMFQEEKTNAESKVFPPCNEYEKRLWPEVISANQNAVTFDDIGAMEDIKESLEELVMLPLQRPDLFKGGILKPCKGVLLFGPPGTGKTMLAKAIANEAGASFINVSMSTITSKWFGEDEKNVRAVFTLASKISPTIIFVDEVDSMLGQRGENEHHCMRKIKNEFMTHWDGLLTKAGERVMVLAATNRPFDLDEAIVRRFERRIMVGLPSVGSREIILKNLLEKENSKDLDFKELATMTEGYTGSDLKNLCITAAYRPARELHQQERKKKDKKKKKNADKGESSEDALDTKEEAKDALDTKEEAKDALDNKEEAKDALDTKQEAKGEKTNVKRPLNMEDMRQAKTQVSASFASDGAVMNLLKEWNELYGEGGGSRKKKQLTYFL